MSSLLCGELRTPSRPYERCPQLTQPQVRLLSVSAGGARLCREQRETRARTRHEPLDWPSWGKDGRPVACSARCFMRPESETRTPHPTSEFPSRLHRYAACPAQQIAVVANIFRMFASFTAARLHSPLEVALRDGPTRSTVAAAVPRVVLDFTWAVNHQRVGAEGQARSVRERRCSSLASFCGSGFGQGQRASNRKNCQAEHRRSDFAP